MNPVIVRNTTIGEGKPKICVPLVGKTQKELLDEAKNFNTIPVDIVEWRVDWFKEANKLDKVIDTAKELRLAVGDIPLLFTFRTAKEGGEKEISDHDYENLITTAIKSGYVDLIDLEIFTGDLLVKKLIKKAHEYGVKVIASNHDFFKTPSKEEIVNRLCKMQDLGADLPKIAVMPKNKSDVLTLLFATLEMNEHHTATPIITMSMASTGMISRLIGESFGSAITFGAAKNASAPGQIGVKELAQVLEIIHHNL